MFIHSHGNLFPLWNTGEYKFSENEYSKIKVAFSYPVVFQKLQMGQGRSTEEKSVLHGVFTKTGFYSGLSVSFLPQNPYEHKLALLWLHCCEETLCHCLPPECAGNFVAKKRILSLQPDPHHCCAIHVPTQFSLPLLCAVTSASLDQGNGEAHSPHKYMGLEDFFYF